MKVHCSCVINDRGSLKNHVFNIIKFSLALNCSACQTNNSRNQKGDELFMNISKKTPLIFCPATLDIVLHLPFHLYLHIPFIWIF